MCGKVYKLHKNTEQSLVMFLLDKEELIVYNGYDNQERLGTV